MGLFYSIPGIVIARLRLFYLRSVRASRIRVSQLDYFFTGARLHMTEKKGVVNVTDSKVTLNG